MLFGMTKQGTSNWPVESVETAFGVIELLAEMDGAGITEIANRLNVAKSTVHDHLRTLEQQEYVVHKNGQYRLGLKFLGHGLLAKDTLVIVKEGKPMLEHIAEETDETVWLVVEEHGKAVYVDVAKGDRAVPTTGSVGRRVPLHVLASGKAILANLPEDRRRALINRNLEERTPNTITDPEELRNELATIRETGIAFNKGESCEGIRAIACPVFKNQQVRGAMVCAGPANRMKGDRYKKRMPDTVSGAANELELKLSYP